jgi:hypothetical protein
MVCSVQLHNDREINARSNAECLKSLEREQEQLTPDVTLSVQWDKYKFAFATQVAKGKVVAEEDPDVAKDTSMGKFVLGKVALCV